MTGTLLTLLLVAGCSTNDWCTRFNLDCTEVPPDRTDTIDEDGDVWRAEEDCDDRNPAIHPSAEELWYDDIDQDCAGDSDWDADGDGYDAWWKPDGTGLDCDDTWDAVNPDAVEVWYDGVDDNCDENFADADGDGQVADFAGGLDCDDRDPDIFFGAPETWYDGIDQDCDPSTENDADADGYWAEIAGGNDCDDQAVFVNAGMAEICDGRDNDCDGVVDGDDVCAGALPVASIIRFDRSEEAFFSEPSIGPATDTDGDGTPEVVIAGQSQDSGAAWLLETPGDIEISLSDAQADIAGEGAGVYLGLSPSGLPDIDDDGYDELVLGGLNAEGETWSNEGVVWLFHGPVTGQVGSSEADATLVGATPSALAGRVLRVAGDLDGDDAVDLLVRTERIDDEAMPTATAPAWLIVPADLSGEQVLDEVATGSVDMDSDGDGITDGTVSQIEPLAVVDANGDGVLDLVLGQPYDGVGGAVAVLYGPIDTTTAQDADARLQTTATSAQAGWAVVAPGDLDGDGNTDLAVSANAWTGAGGAQGVVWMTPMPTSGADRLEDAPHRFVGGSFDAIGSTLTAPGDVDGDGTPDVVAGDAYAAVRLLRGGGSGTEVVTDAPALLPAWLPGAGYAGRPLAVGDLDGDARQEIMVSLVPGLALGVVLSGDGWSAR